jgi:hypothetical protein
MSQSFFPDMGTTYMFRLRVESTPGAGGLYSLKVWEAGQTEPADWNLSIQDDATDLPSGSFQLLAHHVDATYGDVTVMPLSNEPTYTLDVNTVGSGSVQLNPNQVSYNPGDTVELIAQPTPGWAFDSWSGDLTGSANPLEYTIQDDTTITATFTQDEYTLTVNTLGSGSVDITPKKESFSYGDVVTLTATPDFNWFFESWSGDHSGNENPLTLLIEQDIYIIITFDTIDQEISYLPLMINNP